MNSVAVPASAPVGVLSGEHDLVRQAARGDHEAFAELFRRHGQMAWRLAQAVAVDRDGAIRSVAHGFVRAVQRTPSRKASGDAGFRPAVLAGVYRQAIDDARVRAADRGAAPAGAAPTEGDPVMSAAFRSLPERWRAALWLTEVESIAPERMAAILGVSAAAASQLVIRGNRGLAGRLAQAHTEMPEHLAPALRPVGLAMPANLAEMVAAAWGAVATGPGARVAPLGIWLNEHAVRPLQVSVVALIGLGLVGVGLVGEGSTVAPPSIAAPSSPGGTVPYGNLPGGGGAGGGAGSLAGGGIPGLVISSGSAGGASGVLAAGALGSAGGSATSTATPRGSTSATTAPPGTTATSVAGVTTPTTAPTTTPSTTTPPPSNPQSSPTTLVNLAPVASVTSSGGSTSVNVLPTKSGGSTATVTVGCSTGIGIQLGKTTIGCKSAATTTTTVPSSGSSGSSGSSSGSSGGLGGILGGL